MVSDRIAWKISVAGLNGTGKSSLISRVVYDSDGTTSPSKMFSRKRIDLQKNGNRTTADLLLQEISQDPEAERMLPGSNMILILADVTNSQSLDFAQQMIRYSKSFSKNVPVLLVGTKSDLKYEAVIWIEDFEKV